MRNQVMSWSQLACYLKQNPQQSAITVEKHQVQHPTAAGMKRSVGLPVGQIADWRMPAPSCHGLHVREYLNWYTAHVDHANPNCDLPAHIVQDAPAVGGGLALGALVGLAIGESAGAMLVGALLGGALGASVAAAQERALANGGKGFAGGAVTVGGRRGR